MSEILPTLLRADIAPLNQGSFGICPPEVFAEYQRVQREFEVHPDGFMRVVFERMTAARAALAEYLHTAPTNIGFATNATMGVNVVTHSLRSRLKPGDEILTTDHEYNACNNAWRFCCEKTGALYVHQPMQPPMTTAEAFVEQMWKGVTARTRVIYLSHITSPTALIFPIRQIAERARAEGILTVVDGAHAPGHIALSLDELGADFYTGNCHKWMLSPKGTAFVYGRPEVQRLIEPLIVGHHYGGHPRMTGNPFVDYVEFFGTRDVSGFLAVPAAIDFMRRHNWDAMRARCHGLAMAVRERIAALYGFTPEAQLCPPTQAWVGQMAACRIPDDADVAAYTRELREVRGIEVPVLEWGGRKYVRVSVQYYTTEEHLDRLIEALSALR
jgi:isopenicillin-N epimerase